MTPRIFARFAKPSGAVGDTAIYFSTVVAGQLTSLLLLPLITRYLSPEAFGEYSLALVTTGLLGIFGSVWVRNVGMRLYFDYLAEQRTRAFFLTAACLQAAVMTVVLLVGYLVVRDTTSAVPMALYVWAGASVVVSDLYALSANTLRAGQRSFEFGAAELTSSFLRLAATGVGLLAGFRTPAALFACATIAMTVSAAVALRGLRTMLSGPASFDRRVAVDLVRLGVPSIPQSVGTWIMALSDRLLLAHYSGVREVGLYSAVYSVADRAVSGLMSALLMAAWPAILSSWSASKERTPEVISRYLGAYVMLTLGPAVLLAMQREFVLNLLMSPEYVSAAGVIPWVVTGAWLSGAATYLNRPLELHKKYGQLSAISMVSAALNLGLNLLLIPRWGALGAAASTAGAFAGWVVLSRILAARVVHVPLPWLSMGTAAGATLAAVLAGSFLTLPLASIPLFVIVYYAFVYVAWQRHNPVGRRRDASAVLDADTLG